MRGSTKSGYQANSKWHGKLPSYDREWNMEVNQQRQTSPAQWDPGADPGLSSFHSLLQTSFGMVTRTHISPPAGSTPLSLWFYPWCPHPFTWCQIPSVTWGLPNLYFYPRFPLKVPILSVFQMYHKLIVSQTELLILSPKPVSLLSFHTSGSVAQSTLLLEPKAWQFLPFV